MVDISIFKNKITQPSHNEMGYLISYAAVLCFENKAIIQSNERPQVLLGVWLATKI